jgi:hypothetical protein
MEAFVRLNLLKGINGPGHGLLRNFGWICVAVLAIAMFATGVANGQLTGKGAITGTVTDKTGAVIAGASVSARNTATEISTTTTTTGTGDYNFSNLDPGIYTVTTTASGFEKLVQMNIHVNAMETQVYKPTLTVGHASVEVTVTAEPPQLETSNATLGATMENETYAELPIMMGAYGQADQRRATDFAYLMPGVQGNVTNGNATTNTGVVNGSGSRGAASAVYVDGVVFVRAGGNGDPRYVWTAVSVDAIDQFQVQTTGYSAVYEGQGVMNYTVKQGGAKQRGSVYEFFRNTALDTWGFWAKAPVTVNGQQVVQKPVEHSNEYGINLGGPLIPFGRWKNKIFYFANYNGFRYSASTPTALTFPTQAQQQGDFSGVVDSNGKMIKIYDPSSQAACTANSNNGFCRYQYGYGPGAGKGAAGNPKQIGPENVIPTGASGAGVRFDGSKTSEISPVSAAMQALLPTTGIGTDLQNNYMSPNNTGLNNWSTTDRIDYLVTSKDTLSLIAAIGRQASSSPVAQSTAGRNVGPVPFNYGQAYAPKTAIGIIEETHVFSQRLINQVKWGYARYNGPTFNPNQAPAYAATAMGIGNLPAGQAQQTFPIVPFSGTNAPTGWGGTTANLTLAQNYTAMDNLQWIVGKHSFTFGGQVAWMLYNTYSATGEGATSPFVLASAVTETAGVSRGSYSVASGTGLAYASFLLGQIDSTSGKNSAGSSSTFNDYSGHPGYGARFRAISPYVQDNWKLTPKLTLDLGIRYDFYPSVREVKNAASFFDPNLANPITGMNGALNFTGHGAGTCNCDSPVKNYYKNIAPRLGLAYQLNSKTVIRSSYGIMFTHGNAVGGLTSTLGTLGFSAAPPMSSASDATSMVGLLNSSALDASGNPIAGAGSGSVPSYSAPKGVASGAGYGTGYTKTAGYTGGPSTFTYDDPYLGGRAPEYINWSFGIQRQITNALAISATYVGSEGHFLQLDSYTARGAQSNQLDPKYLVLGKNLSDQGGSAGAIGTDCSSGGVVVTNGFSCDATALSIFATNQSLSTLLKPHPFQSVSDSFGYVGNANYHSLQVMANLRAWHGLTVNANYSWSRAIDDGGTFRTGYAIPAGTIANHPNLSYKADEMERTVSTSNQPQHLVLTTVWDWPFGRTVLAESSLKRAIMGGFKFSGIYQAYSGSPLAITESATQTNQAQSSTAPPIMNPNFSGKVRQNGKWGKGATTSNYTTISYITPSTGKTTAEAQGPFMAPVGEILSSYAYKFSDAPRTAPYGLTGPGNYQLDLAMVRSFPLHFTESAKLNIRAEWYNVTNHTQFAVASTAVGNASFGQVTSSGTANRKAAQFSARIEF